MQNEKPVEAYLMPDGSVEMRDLPFFSEVRPDDECTKGPNGRPVRDRAYLEKALEIHETRRRVSKYNPPMNKRHIFDDPERVGTYRLTHLGEAVVNPDDVGRPRATIFCTKVWKNLDAFRGSDGYDYRSPEISPDEPDEFGALALLKDKAPFNKYENVDPGQVPVVEVAVPEAFEARGYQAPQVWRRERAMETFGPRVQVEPDGNGGWRPVRTAQDADINAKADAEIERAKSEFNRIHHPWNSQLGLNLHAQIVRAIKAGRPLRETVDRMIAGMLADDHSSRTGEAFQATENKEGDMPAATETKPEKKEPSLEERMEAMAAKCFEGMAKRFETMFGDAMKKKDKAEEAEDKPSTPEGEDVKAKEKKSSGPETAETRSSPDQALPPAVSSSRPGETFQTAVSALSKAERDEYLGMKAYVQKQQKKEQAQTSAAQGEKVLSDAKCPVSEEIRAVLRTEAFESGAAGVKSCVAGILLGFQQRTVGADQILGTGLGFDPGASSEDTGLKAAYEEFGSRPESRLHVERLWQDYRNAPGDFRNKIKFPDLCRASLNPNAPRGGM